MKKKNAVKMFGRNRTRTIVGGVELIRRHDTGQLFVSAKNAKFALSVGLVRHNRGDYYVPRSREAEILYLLGL